MRKSEREDGQKERKFYSMVWWEKQKDVLIAVKRSSDRFKLRLQDVMIAESRKIGSTLLIIKNDKVRYNYIVEL